ncbi:SDR family NAD(P)-dependent oxidoreductase, partial [Enterobacter cloacae]|uniref:SDR family NAD(P)-dependent oxidoreductase n=2 Tax=Pseudomonadota TaxID=1224 RepID=UPI0013D4EF47
QEAANETAAIIAAEGFSAMAVTSDVTSSASVTEAVNATIERYGRIDILHNNVGVATAGGPEDLDDEKFRMSLDINVGSVFRTAKAVLPH